MQHIKHIMQLCDSAMTHMIGVLNDVPQVDVNRTLNFENEINDYRKLLKEKLGDYIVNVVEAHANRRLSV